MARHKSITGRDQYIIVQALATTYALIKTLPEQCQAISNCEDMGALLRHICGSDWMVALQLRHPLSEDEWLNGIQLLPGLELQDYLAAEMLPSAPRDFGLEDYRRD